MQAFFLRDTLEEQLLEKIASLDNEAFAKVISSAYGVHCTVCKPSEGDLVIHDIEKSKELKNSFNCHY